jgi:hypothetical protein
MMHARTLENSSTSPAALNDAVMFWKRTRELTTVPGPPTCAEVLPPPEFAYTDRVQATTDGRGNGMSFAVQVGTET